MSRLNRPELARGDELNVLVDLPGFSLARVWFKPECPLPRHSLDRDCLYYIVAGSLQLGTQELGPRDSFILPANVPFSYTVGPEGWNCSNFAMPPISISCCWSRGTRSGSSQLGGLRSITECR